MADDVTVLVGDGPGAAAAVTSGVGDFLNRVDVAQRAQTVFLQDFHAWIHIDRVCVGGGGGQAGAKCQDSDQRGQYA
jgi:hypothetical protein